MEVGLRFVRRAGVLSASGAATALLAGCTQHTSYVNPGRAVIGQWSIERKIDRVTSAAVSNSVLPTMRVASGGMPFPLSARLQLMWFKERSAVVVAFGFKIGATCNIEVRTGSAISISPAMRRTYA